LHTEGMQLINEGDVFDLFPSRGMPDKGKPSSQKSSSKNSKKG